MLAAKEVPDNFNESRQTFYNTLEEKSLFFAVADFGKKTWKIGTLNTKKAWKPAMKIWVQFVKSDNAASGDSSNGGKKQGKQAGEHGKLAVEEVSYFVNDLNLDNYGLWWGLAKASSGAVNGVWKH